MSQLILFNKPFQVLSQFTTQDDKTTLAAFIDTPDVYPAGRLDYDSEGLMILTDNGQWQRQISDPKFHQWKTYLAQVEGAPSRADVVKLCRGVKLNDGLSKPARAKKVDSPDWLWPRQPAIRERKNIPTQWLQIEICEGRNRQVRRMSAAIGFPVLRLIRTQVSDWTLDGLEPGQSKQGTFSAPQRF